MTGREAMGRFSRRSVSSTVSVEPARTMPGRLTVFCSAKGGEGATSVAIGVARALAEHETVVLADGDGLFGDVALRLGLDPNTTNAAQDPVPVSPGLTVWLPPQRNDLTASPDRDAVVWLLTHLQWSAGHVIVDAPPLRGLRLDVAPLADRLLLVTRPDIASVKNTLVALRLLNRAGMPNHRLEIVVNGYRPRDHPSVRDLRQALGVAITATIPDQADAGHAPAIARLAETLRA